MPSLCQTLTMLDSETQLNLTVAAFKELRPVRKTDRSAVQHLISLVLDLLFLMKKKGLHDL